MTCQQALYYTCTDLKPEMLWNTWGMHKVPICNSINPKLLYKHQMVGGRWVGEQVSSKVVKLAHRLQAISRHALCCHMNTGSP